MSGVIKRFSLAQNQGTAQASYVGSLIEAHGGAPNDEERDAIAWTAVSFFTGGVDTVSYRARILSLGLLSDGTDYGSDHNFHHAHVPVPRYSTACTE